jgi:flavorubredoxin
MNITEKEALQNAANDLNLIIVEHQAHDKRKTVGKYFAIDSKFTSVSPTLDYEQLNHFLLGYRRAMKTFKN